MVVDGSLHPPPLTEARWLELAQAGRWWWHLPSGTEWHDAQWCRLVGQAEPSGPTHNEAWRALLHPDDVEETLQCVRQALQAPAGRRYEALFRLRHADGGWRWMHSRGDVLRNPEGRPEWLVGLQLDVTQAMQTVERLELTQDWLTDLDALIGGFRFVTWYRDDGEPLEVEYVSCGIERVSGVPAQAVQRDIGRLRERIPEEDLREIRRCIAATIARRESRFFLRYRICNPADTAKPCRWIQATASGTYGQDGRSRWAGVAIDVTDWMQAQQRQQSAVAQLEATLASLPDLWFELDTEGRYVRVHATDADLLVLPADHLIGRHPDEVLPPDVAHLLTQALEQAKRSGAVQSVQYALELPGGGRHFEARIATRQREAAWDGFMLVVRDITETVMSRAAREHALLHDTLTGQWNRSGFLDGGVTRWLDRHAGCRDAHCLLLMLDIDGLRQLNHALGTAVGDDLIKAIAQRLTDAIDDGVVGRVGGDELAVLCHLKPVPESAAPIDEAPAQWVSRLQQSLAAPIRLGTLDYRPSITIGWTLLSCREGINLPLVRDALIQVEESLYAAKRQGPGRLERFDAQRFAAARQRHLLAQALSGAMSSRELWLAFQPIVDRHGATLGHEALLRWRSTLHGDVSPADFIGLAEQSGAIVAIGRWALRQACAHAARAAVPQGHPPTHVAVNVSPLQFMQPDFEDDVCRALHDSGLATDRLRLEVTESLLIEDLPTVAAKMQRLAKRGVRFALDDFGTGYSNLLQLRSLPLDTIKIDRSFTRDLFIDDNDALIVRSIIELAHRLNLRVVAEGVETAAQADWLIAHGCDALQGYWFGRPGRWDDVARTG